jgi:hypothetical protein
MGNINSIIQNCDFAAIRDAYTKARRIQRDKIVEKLQEISQLEFIGQNGDRINPLNFQSGRGKTTYTSNGSIAPYNLNNWQWISVKYTETEFEISLNPIERDANTKCVHGLLDRIAFWDERNPLETYFTEYDLPLSNKEIDSLVKDFIKYCGIT